MIPAQDGIDEPRPVGSAEDLPSADAGSPSGDDVEADIDALTAAEQQRDEYLELAKRTKADFENYRKRMAAEVQAANARGKGELALDLIGAVDNLERALDAVGVNPEEQDPSGNDPQVENGEALAQGVLLVLRGMRETLRRHGIEALDPKGEKFDPQWHEALSTQPADDAEPGAVVDVMQKGYRLGEQLIRPARVVVAE